MRKDIGSQKIAKERLKLVLVYDRSLLPQSAMESLREDLLQIIGRYLPLQEKSLTLEIEGRREKVVLVGTISLTP